MRFRFIRRQQKVYPIVTLCRVMRVSRSAYYSYIERQSKREREGPSKLDLATVKAFERSRGTYGTRRISAQLRRDGHQVGRHRARTLMRKNGLKVRRKKRFKRTTDSRHSHPIAPNLLERDFNPPAPNQVWTGDITYVWTREGWLYLAVLIDLFSRQVVGWAIDRLIDSSLVEKALLMAQYRRRPAEGLIHHTDRGSQYASETYRKLLDRFQMRASMSKKGDCWDNAPTERFFGSLKREQLDELYFNNRAEAELEIIDYITYYNAYRLHSTLGYMPPMEAERKVA